MNGAARTTAATHSTRGSPQERPVRRPVRLGRCSGTGMAVDKEVDEKVDGPESQRRFDPEAASTCAAPPCPVNFNSQPASMLENHRAWRLGSRWTSMAASRADGERGLRSRRTTGLEIQPSAEPDFSARGPRPVVRLLIRADGA